MLCTDSSRFEGLHQPSLEEPRVCHIHWKVCVKIPNISRARFVLYVCWEDDIVKYYYCCIDLLCAGERGIDPLLARTNVHEVDRTRMLVWPLYCGARNGVWPSRPMGFVYRLCLVIEEGDELHPNGKVPDCIEKALLPNGVRLVPGKGIASENGTTPYAPNKHCRNIPVSLDRSIDVSMVVAYGTTLPFLCGARADNLRTGSEPIAVLLYVDEFDTGAAFERRSLSTELAPVPASVTRSRTKQQNYTAGSAAYLLTHYCAQGIQHRWSNTKNDINGYRFAAQSNPGMHMRACWHSHGRT